MPRLTPVLSNRECSPLTPIHELDPKLAANDGSLTLSSSSSEAISDSDSASPPSSRDSSTNPSPTAYSQPRKVSFPSADSPVTSMSRPLSNAELWPLYYFEQHSRSCADCFNPYDVHKEGGVLCHDGQRQGAAIACIIYSKFDGQDIYAVSDLGSSEMTKVELPRQYVQVRSLLRTVERICKARRKPEKTMTVSSEDDGKQREFIKARQQSPDRKETKPRGQHYRAPSPDSKCKSGRQRSPLRSDRSVTRSYHESELSPRRTSTSPPSSSSSSSTSPGYTPSKPVDIIQRSLPSSSRPNPTTTQSSLPNTPSFTAKPDPASYPQATLPFRRRSVPDGPSNAFPARGQTTGGPAPPTSYRHSTNAPFKPSPLTQGTGRSSSVTRKEGDAKHMPEGRRRGQT